jgi:hypothetical protein
LKETVSADEDSDDSQDEISEEQKNSTRSINEGEDHDDANDSEEMADAFNFDQSKVRKTFVPSMDVMQRQSRIGNILRSSQIERPHRGQTVTSNVDTETPDSAARLKRKATQLNSHEKPPIQKIKDVKLEENKKKTEEKAITKSNKFGNFRTS